MVQQARQMAPTPQNFQRQVIRPIQQYQVPQRQAPQIILPRGGLLGQVIKPNYEPKNKVAKFAVDTMLGTKEERQLASQADQVNFGKKVLSPEENRLAKTQNYNAQMDALDIGGVKSNGTLKQIAGDIAKSKSLGAIKSKVKSILGENLNLKGVGKTVWNTLKDETNPQKVQDILELMRPKASKPSIVKPPVVKTEGGIQPTIQDEIRDITANKMTTKVQPPSPMVGKEPGIIKRVMQTAITPGKTTLRNMNTAGAELGKKIVTFRGLKERISGTYKAYLNKTLTPNVKEQVSLTFGKNKTPEVMNARRLLRGEIPSGDAKTTEIAKTFRTILDSIYSKAQQVGIDVKEKLPDYFPKIYDWNKFNKPNNKLEALNHMVQTGQAKTLYEAESIFDRFLSDPGLRKSGSLEHSRVLDLPEKFEVNPIQAIETYIDDNSRRIAEASQFGPKGEKAAAIIDEVTNLGGDRKFAQEVYELMTGIKKYENPVVDGAIKLSYLTKLSLSFIVNATQPINTAMKTGIVRTLNELMQSYITPYRAGRRAMRTGAIEDSISKGQAEGINMGTITRTIMSVFQAVEKKNRTTAANAGESYTKDLAKALVKNPKDATAIRQLKTIGLDVNKILEQGGVTPTDILVGAKGTSDTTQFLVDAMELPPGWKTNIGRMLGALKSFSYKQTGFVYNEILKETAHGNVMPLIRLMILVPPTMYAANYAKSVIKGQPLTEEQKYKPLKLKTYTGALTQGTLPQSVYDSYKYQKKQLALSNSIKSPAQKALGVAGTVLGPVVSDFTDTASNALGAVDIARKNALLGIEKKKSNPYLALEKQYTQKIPVIGPYISNTYLPWENNSTPKTAEDKAEGQKYYQVSDQVRKTLTTAEQGGFDLLHSSKDGTDQRLSAQQKASIYLNMPNTLKADTALYRQLKNHDPFYDLDARQQNAYNLAHMPLPGESADLKKAVLYTQPWYEGFMAKREKYYNDLTLKTGQKPEDNGYPAISPGLKAKQDAFFKLGDGKSKQAYLLKNPDLLAYWDKKDAYTNGERAQLGMPPMAEDNGGGFKPWPKTLPKMKVSRPTISMPKITATKRKVSMPKLKVVKPSNSKITKASLSRGR